MYRQVCPYWRSARRQRAACLRNIDTAEARFHLSDIRSCKPENRLPQSRQRIGRPAIADVTWSSRPRRFDQRT
jgi:hypothetical protein